MQSSKRAIPAPLCATIVKCNKRFQIEQNRQTEKHPRKMSCLPVQHTAKTHSFLQGNQKYFTINIVKAFS